MLAVQQFIKDNGWSALESELGIKVREYDNGFRCLSYSQIDSPKTHPVVLQSRGIILDGDLNIICRPFDRFFNFGEADTQDFDFSNCTILEKLDGSLVKIYWNPVDVRWEIATRGTAFAEAAHAFGLETDGSFRDYILQAMNFTEEEFQFAMSKIGNQDLTYICEYCSWKNRIVTKYDSSFMVLLGVRDKNTGEDGDISEHVSSFLDVGMNIRLPEVYTAKTEKEVKELCESLPGLKEGFVLREVGSGRRVKMKSAQYIALHHLRGEGVPNKNAIMELVLSGETDEILLHFPEYIPMIDPVKESLKNMLAEMEIVYNTHSDIVDQKEFALAVKNSSYSSVLFSARKKKCTTFAAFYESNIQQQMNLLLSFDGSEN